MFKRILDIDKNCTELLRKGVIIKEDAFTSNFIVKNYEDGNFVIKGIRNTKPAEEQKLGCDGMIILKSKERYGIGFWEAKLPKKNSWDYKEHNPQKYGYQYHFNKQMFLQQKAGVHSWEMFYNNGELVFNNDFLDKTLCVWRNDIFNQKHDYKWDAKALESFVFKNPLKCKNIKEILDGLSQQDACWVKEKDDKIYIGNTGESILVGEIDNDHNDGFFKKIMRRFGLKYVIFIEQQSMTKN